MGLAARGALANHVCALVGADVTQNVEPGSGWPARLDIIGGGDPTPVTLHVATVTEHDRDPPKPYEWRFQNPGQNKPPVSLNGSLPLLVGVDLLPTPVLVVVDARSRLGRMTRFSILFHERVLAEAREAGWSEYVSNKGERMFAMHPRLLPVLVEMLSTDAVPPARELALAAQAAGLPEGIGDDTVLAAVANRARRAALVLVRRTRFGETVRQAYGGRCCMCGLGIGLVQGAHIKPVSAPGSTDHVWNGLALCANHHGLFDSHRLWVNPDTYQVIRHPSLLEAAEADPVVAQFNAGTRDTIELPAVAAHHPRPDMFRERYELFEAAYVWR